MPISLAEGTVVTAEFRVKREGYVIKIRIDKKLSFPINAHTRGVVGLSNLSLQQANGDRGSVMASEKNNVKLESGTMLLLKVNQ